MRAAAASPIFARQEASDDLLNHQLDAGEHRLQRARSAEQKQLEQTAIARAGPTHPKWRMTPTSALKAWNCYLPRLPNRDVKHLKVSEQQVANIALQP